jgi:hypothetical protein
MNAIRIRKKIDSETIHIPELRPMIGHEVEIIVVDDRQTAASVDGVDPNAFWKGKTIDELAAEQGVAPYSSDDPRRVTFSEEDFEGFDETLEAWRNEG